MSCAQQHYAGYNQPYPWCDRWVARWADTHARPSRHPQYPAAMQPAGHTTAKYRPDPAHRRHYPAAVQPTGHTTARYPGKHNAQPAQPARHATNQSHHSQVAHRRPPTPGHRPSTTRTQLLRPPQADAARFTPTGTRKSSCGHRNTTHPPTSAYPPALLSAA